MLLPDGTRHDGCLRADDMGGAIKEHKLDFFVESYNNFKFIADNLWWHMKATPHLDEPRCEYLRLARRRASATTSTPTGWRSIRSSSSGGWRRRSRCARRRAIAAMAKAWLTRHSGTAPKGHTALARKK